MTDMAVAKCFYTEAFDLKFNDYGPDYAGIQKQGGGESGGAGDSTFRIQVAMNWLSGRRAHKT